MVNKIENGGLFGAREAIVPPLIEQPEDNSGEFASNLISKVIDIDILQARQPRNFVGEVFTFKTKEQRKNELTEKVNEIEKSKELVTSMLNDEELSDGAINFLAYALDKEDARDDAKWEKNMSPSERIRSFAENIVLENLPVFENYIENTVPGNTKQTFRIIEKIVQLNQAKIFESISESDLEKPEELLKNFDYLRSNGEIPADFESDFLKLPGAKNYLAILKFLEKQAPTINEKIKEGLNKEPKFNEIIHEYVSGFESGLKYLPIAKAKELSNQVGELFKIQDDNHRGILDIFIADYAVEMNRENKQEISEFSHDRAGELQIGAKAFATAGYQYKEIGPAWNNSTNKEGFRDMMINNFASLHELENKRPGSAKYLTDNFGVVCFSRYPTEVLIKQYDDRDKTGSPFGIYATGRSDHNGSMYDFNKKIKIKKLTDETESNGYMLKIIEIANTVDATKRIINLTKKLEKKVSFMFVNAHGNTDVIAIGNWDGFRRELTTSDIWKPGTQKFFQYFEEGSTLVLSSCLTGSDKGIAEEIAKTSGMTVIASDQKTQGINKLEIEKYKNNGLKFDVTFYSGKKNKPNVIFNEKK